MTDDTPVYADPDGTHYVAVDGDGTWYRWPAERNGWASRARCGPTDHERCRPLDTGLSTLAIRLSGAGR